MNQKLKVKVKNGPSGKSQVISGDSKERAVRFVPWKPGSAPALI